VLTVTDGAADPDNRGIINFVISDGRVRFEIDNLAAEASRLTISSKLLSLAVRVAGKG
jgi:YfiR/HmsC-like